MLKHGRVRVSGFVLCVCLVCVLEKKVIEFEELSNLCRWVFGFSVFWVGGF